MNLGGQGWADLLKHFVSSKLTAVACFAMCAVGVIGPRLTDQIPTIPKTFFWVFFLAMIFFGVLCLWWGVKATAEWVSSTWSKLVAKLFPVKVSSLSKDEAMVISLLRSETFLSMEIYSLADHQAFAEPSVARLAVDSLERRGIVTMIRGRVTLTTAGQKLLIKNTDYFGPAIRNAKSWMG